MKTILNLNSAQPRAGTTSNSRWPHRLFTLFALFLVPAYMLAQNPIQISGTVMEGDEPLIGVSVVVKGTTNGTVTDFDGAYTLTAMPQDTLTFSYIGYLSREVLVNNRTVISEQLTTNTTTMEEVIVVGYGTRKKSHNTGAIASVGGPEIAAIQATRVDDALAGKLSGVLIQNQDGSPGADPKIQIRAGSSISGDSDPLIVVNGFPISGNLATVNPSDIQSLEVLKDAASAAIYGSRGANGVILVTTKSGSTGKPSISYNSYVSVSNRYRNELEQLKTAGEWATELEAGIASGRFDVSEVDPRVVDYRINGYKDAPGVRKVEDFLYRTGVSTSHDFGINGGTDDVKYYASVGYLNQEGVVLSEGFERYNVRMNVDAKLGKRFSTGLSVNGFMSDRDILGDDQRDLLRAYNISPIYHTAESIAFVQDLDAKRQVLADAGVRLTTDPEDLTRPSRLEDTFDDGWRGGDAPFNNSIYTLEPGMPTQDWHYGRNQNGIGGTGDAGVAVKFENTDRFEKTYFGNINSYLQYQIVDGLNIRTVLGGDINDSQFSESKTLEYDSQARVAQTYLRQTDLKRSSVLSETTLNYSKVLGNHNVSAVAGLEFQNFYRTGIALRGTNVPVGQPLNFALFDPADVSLTERRETIARRSVFGRINYAYDNRYLASVSVRRDGDSRFGENNKFQTFPAVSLGWNLHNEDFYNSDFITDVKLRFSAGSLGTTSFLGAYSSLSLLNPQATIFGNGFLIPNNVGNPDLTWQTNTETNYGLNLGFLENRFTASVDYYTSDIEDILINQSVSEVLGTTSIALNSGDVRSSGVELELGAAIINRPGLRWNVGANLSTVTTEITSLGGLDELPRTVYGQSGRGPEFRNYVGGEIGEMWGLETDGIVEDIFMVDPTRVIGSNSSEYYVVDQNGDGEINEEDYVKIGQNTPDFYWGLNTTVIIKDFDVSLQFQGAQGAEVFNIDQIYWRSEFGGRLRSSFDDTNNSDGSAGGDGIADHNGKFYTQSRNQLDAQIQDASYTALRNMTVGYTVNPNKVDKLGLSSLRVYVAATNLMYLMADGYTSQNPEGVEITNPGYLGPTTYGVQVGASPVVRSFSLGLNVNF